MKLSDIPDAPAAEPAGEGKARKLSQIGADDKGAPAATGAGGSTIGALWRGFLHGVGSAGVEAGKLGADIVTPDVLGRQRLVDRIARFQQQRQQQHAAQPYVQAHPTAARMGEIGGEIAPTLALPGGALMKGATLPAKMVGGATAGAAGAATTPTAGGDFWKQKAAQLGMGALAGGAVGGAAGALAPRGPAAVMAKAGVPLTAGMQTGMRPVENALSTFPVLGTAIRRGELRTLDGFNRATVEQALEPIGAKVPRNMKSGHGLVDFAKDQLDKAYDKVLPYVSFSETGWQQMKPQVQAIADELSTDHAQRLARFIKNRVTSRFNGGIMDGRAFKTAESELSNKATTYGRGTQDAELGDALHQVASLMRDSLAQQNPAQAAELRNINSAYAMFTRVRQAASGATSEGKFTPSDLLRAARRQAGASTFARGDALMQTFAEAADKTLGKIAPAHATIPSSGLRNLATLLELGGGGGFMAGGAEGGGIGAGAAAALPYAAYGAMRGGAALGRTPGPIAGRGAAMAGRAAAAPIPKVADRMKAARKVGEISSQLYAAKRKGDLGEVQKLTADLSSAQAAYNSLRPAQ